MAGDRKRVAARPFSAKGASRAPGNALGARLVRRARWVADWHREWRRPANVIGLIALPVLLLLALYPFLAAIRQSLGEPATVGYWQALLSGGANDLLPFWNAAAARAYLWTPLAHSLVIAGAVTVAAGVLGAGLACLSSLTNLRYAQFLQAAALLHLALPPFALAMAWLSLASMLRFGDGWMFGPRPMILVLTLHFYALVYLFVGSAARNLHGSLIEAGEVHGARPWSLVRRIVLPMLRPALLGSAALIFFSTLAAFAPLRLLGGGRRPYYVLATQVYSLYADSLGDPRAGVLAIALALILALVACPPALLFLKLLRDGRRYASVEGRGHRPPTIDLGRWRDPLSLLCLVGAVATVVGPLFVLFAQSLSPGMLTSLDPHNLSLAAYRTLFAAGVPFRGIAGSLALALIAATAGVACATPLAYAVQRTTFSSLRTVMYVLMFLPFVLPGVALGLIYYELIAPTRHVLGLAFSFRFLYGTLLLAVIVTMARHLPLAVQSSVSAFVQLNTSLEEAAYVHGASFAAALRRVLLPLVRRGVLVTWLLLLIFVFKEIDVLAFVYPPVAISTSSGAMPLLSDVLRAPPIMYQVFSLINTAEVPQEYAQGTALLLIAILVLLSLTLVAARLGRGRGGDAVQAGEGIVPRVTSIRASSTPPEATRDPWAA